MPWQQSGTKRSPIRGKEREKIGGDEKEKGEIVKALMGINKEMIKPLRW